MEFELLALKTSRDSRNLAPLSSFRCNCTSTFQSAVNASVGSSNDSISNEVKTPALFGPLPNSWGAFTTLYGMLTSANGAMAVSSQVPTLLEARPSGGSSYEVLNYSADRGNAIYGNSSTVQPAAMRSPIRNLQRILSALRFRINPEQCAQIFSEHG